MGADMKKHIQNLETATCGRLIVSCMPGGRFHKDTDNGDFLRGFFLVAPIILLKLTLVGLVLGLGACSATGNEAQAGDRTKHNLLCTPVAGNISRCVNDEVVCYKRGEDGISCLPTKVPKGYLDEVVRIIQETSATKEEVNAIRLQTGEEKKSEDPLEDGDQGASHDGPTPPPAWDKYQRMEPRIKMVHILDDELFHEAFRTIGQELERDWIYHSEIPLLKELMTHDGETATEEYARRFQTRYKLDDPNRPKSTNGGSAWIRADMERDGFLAKMFSEEGVLAYVEASGIEYSEERKEEFQEIIAMTGMIQSLQASGMLR